MQVWVDVVATDRVVAAVAAAGSAAVVAVNEELGPAAVADMLTHNLSLHVLVHALFPHCLSCSEWGNGQN